MNCSYEYQERGESTKEWKQIVPKHSDTIKHTGLNCLLRSHVIFGLCTCRTRWRFCLFGSVLVVGLFCFVFTFCWFKLNFKDRFLTTLMWVAITWPLVDPSSIKEVRHGFAILCPSCRNAIFSPSVRSLQQGVHLWYSCNILTWQENSLPTVQMSGRGQNMGRGSTAPTASHRARDSSPTCLEMAQAEFSSTA